MSPFRPSAAATALLSRVRRLALIEATAWTLPAWAVLRFLQPPGSAPWIDAIGLLAFASIIGLRHRQRSADWLAHRLNARLPCFEDSASLLFNAGTGMLAPLQRQRLEQRLPHASLTALGLRPYAVWMWLPPLLAMALHLLPILGTTPPPHVVPAPKVLAGPKPPMGPPSMRASEVRIRPPRYTGLAETTQNTLDIETVAGSHIDWAVLIDPAAQTAALVFIDGRRLELGLEGGHWRGNDTPQASSRYRLEIDGVVQAPDDAAARLTLNPDQPPQIRVRRPGQTLNIVESASALELEIEASDDYGLGPAELLLTLAKGDGEMVEVSEQRLALQGEGDARNRRYLRRLDLAALGFETGNDLILRVEIVDNHGQRARSPSYILRWPKLRNTEGEGVEGFVQRTLPAYFRSQRQIIIDTEALIADRPALERERLLMRSDGIGVDQRLLRLRYGEFLGEEVENDGPLLPEGHSLDDGHGHSDPAAFGDTDALLRAYGHAHDQEEGTTLFDPVTRERLRSALREMWQSELHLRMGDPIAALPYQYRALDLIKQIQQASRIYLARVGLELPPIMFSRRLTGDRSTAVRARDPLRAAERGDAALASMLVALGDEEWGSTESVVSGAMGRTGGDRVPAPPSHQGSDAPRDEATADLDGKASLQTEALAAFEDWLATQPLESTLDLRERFERVQRDPACQDCRTALASALWQRLSPPPQGPRARAGTDVQGTAWLRALEQAQ